MKALAALLLVLAAWLPQARAQDTAPFNLRWEVERTVPDPAIGHRSQARFVVEPTGAMRLGATGWALYFSCIGEAEEGPMPGGLLVERVRGTLYRVRPGAGFAGMADGQPLVLPLRHEGTMGLTDRAPQGAYFVFDSEPGRGLAPASYRVVVPTQPDQLGGKLLGPTPEQRFERHAEVAAMPREPLPPVFPPPLSLKAATGELRWRAMPRIEASRALAAEAALAREWLAPFVDRSAKASGPPLRLSIGAVRGQPSAEAHELTVHPTRGVAIRSASAAGVSRGLQSLRALLPLAATPAEGLSLPALTVRDAPRFAHRGLLIDVARHFHSKAELMRIVDTMARLKLNVLHLHLTDDEGWRIAIPGLPELTDFGGRRGHAAEPAPHLPPAHGSGPDPQTSSGSGFYTEADYAEILRFAAARHVAVIPEIEMPGHARAAVQAMHERARRLGSEDFRLADPADRSRYRSAQLHDDHLMDPGLPSTYRFIEHVVRELAAMHRRAGVPLKQLHVGADELPAGAWAGSPASLALIEREHLAGLPGLWNLFYDRVAAILQRHGIAAAGWEELGSRRARPDGGGPLVPNEHFARRGFTLFVWNNLDDADDLAYRLANAGYHVVLAPATRLYFDMAHSKTPGESGVNWAAITDLADVFDHVPLDALRALPTEPGAPAGKARLTAAGRRHIAGIQATLFGEVMPTRERIEQLMLPRLFALAERAWSAEPAWARGGTGAEAAHRQDWARFVRQVGTQLLPALQRDLPDLAYRIPPPGLHRGTDGRVLANAAWPGLVVRHTTDGSEPMATSPAVGDDGVQAGAVLLRAAAFDAQGRRGLSSSLDLR